MLYVIGLGLGDEKDITLKGLEAVKICDKVYIEAYTSLLSFGLSSNGLSSLEELYGKSLIVADIEMVEEKADDILSEARESNVAFLISGSSSAEIGNTGQGDTQCFGKECSWTLWLTTLPLWCDSFYEKIQSNRVLGSHTLCLIDIRVKGPSLESLCRGKKQYERPRYMTVNTAIEQLLEVEHSRGQAAYSEEPLVLMIVAASMKELLAVDFGAPLHCLVIVGKTHPVEEEMLEFYSLKKA
ncbi:hypothetical protein MKX01_012851 [Papaver californicum]|nr:hypothetical protein MKX01_012851 [Papaver californicum]